MTAISAANGHALAIGPGNAVYAWGSGLRGALGDGVDGNTRTTPQLVTLP
jgi:alpha-tubulin suppressor-like RCC1 family protein